MRVETLIELARANDVKLPSYDVSELRRTIFKTDFANLEVTHITLIHLGACSSIPCAGIPARLHIHDRGDANSRCV